MAAASAASASSSEITPEGPVLNLVNKRLRALRKKLNRVNQMEEALSQGKALNKEQEETLRTKPSLLAGIDELEKLRLPLSQAVDQEIELALVEKSKHESDLATGGVRNETEVKAVDDGASAVTDLINLLYFGGVFDVETLINAHDNMLTRTHERNCCLTYDYVTDDDAAGDPLKERDLDLVALLGGFLISRPVNSSLSHKDALQKCVEHAKLWLAKADQPVEPNSGITYAGLREKLNKIMGSDYFTTAPEIKAPVEVAAAGGNYTFQDPTDDEVGAPVSASAPIEGPSVEYQKEEEHLPTSHANETYEGDDNKGHLEDPHQEVSEVENSTQTEQDSDFQEVLFSRKQHHQQNHRGGRGCRGGGYGNGRGGRGGYHPNGRSQYYDQQGGGGGGYHPRNSHYRGRGGRGGRMGSNHGYQAQETSS